LHKNSFTILNFILKIKILVSAIILYWFIVYKADSKKKIQRNEGEKKVYHIFNKVTLENIEKTLYDFYVWEV